MSESVAFPRKPGSSQPIGEQASKKIYYDKIMRGLLLRSQNPKFKLSNSKPPENKPEPSEPESPKNIKSPTPEDIWLPKNDPMHQRSPFRRRLALG